MKSQTETAAGRTESNVPCNKTLEFPSIGVKPAAASPGLTSKARKPPSREVVSWTLGREAAVERKQERADSRQSEGIGFRNSLGGKGDVVEFNLAWCVTTEGGKLELPALTFVRRYVNAIHRVRLSRWGFSRADRHRRQSIAGE